MARRKRNSTTLERAERRLESLRSIETSLDFGGGISIANYTRIIDDLESKLAAYNTALSTIDKLADDVTEAERLVKRLSEQILLGVGSCYGKTSQEYEMAGGRRRTSRPASVTASTKASTPSNSTNGTAPTSPSIAN